MITHLHFITLSCSFPINPFSSSLLSFLSLTTLSPIAPFHLSHLLPLPRFVPLLPNLIRRLSQTEKDRHLFIVAEHFKDLMQMCWCDGCRWVAASSSGLPAEGLLLSPASLLLHLGERSIFISIVLLSKCEKGVKAVLLGWYWGWQQKEVFLYYLLCCGIRWWQVDDGSCLSSSSDWYFGRSLKTDALHDALGPADIFRLSESNIWAKRKLQKIFFCLNNNQL